MVIIAIGGYMVPGLTPFQRRVMELRRSFTQREVASMLGVSQASVSKAERAVLRKVMRAIAVISDAEELGILFRVRVSEDPLENCLIILRFTSVDYALTGVTGQWLLVGYYRLGEEVEIRTNCEALSALYGVRVVGELDPSERRLWVKGLAVAVPERVVADCILRGDVAGMKSAGAVLLWERCDLARFVGMLGDGEGGGVFLELVSAINAVCGEYGIASPYEGFSASKFSKRVHEVVTKVVDDLAPFLEEREHGR